MSCMEKRHMSNRVGSMLHHRFPNGFTDMFMDETDREVSTLTDRAFRSLCVGDDAVYNDEFSHGYSPFSCHKPLAGEPLKKTHHKESKKHGQNKSDKKDVQPWKKQQQKNISNMSSFLKALSATKEGCEGMLNKNGGMRDSNGESWDKSALRSIQRELSEFSSDYHTNLTDGHYKNRHRCHSEEGSSLKHGKDAGLSSVKSSKIKNGKSTVKLRKLNIKNFFLHSEFSPFQTWTDVKRFPFSKEDTSIIPTDNIAKWYDLSFYKELRDTHREKTLNTEQTQSSQEAAAEPPPPPTPPPPRPSLPPPTAPKPITPLSPPKVLPKPSVTQPLRRCSLDSVDGSAAPWRRAKSGADSVTQATQPPQDNCPTVGENVPLVKTEAKSVDVKAVEEVNSLASTPFSICQLMTPLIPSRQPTDTSEILQAVLSPSVLDLPRRPHSEAKLTPEPPVKRDGYKSLASSILFNLKDNRKRVKSRYSPPKFKTLEENDTQSPQFELLKHPLLGSEGDASGLSTPAIIKDGQTVSSPILESVGTRDDTNRPPSDDYLLSNLLQSKREAASHSSLGEENLIPLIKHSKKNKSPIAKKQNYPSLNLYKKASPVNSEMKYLQVPQIDQPNETSEVSALSPNRELIPKVPLTNLGLSPNTLNVCSPSVSPHALKKEGPSSGVSAGKRPPNAPDKAKEPVRDDKSTSGQHMSTMDVIRAAKEAINAAKNKALSAAQKPISETEELMETERAELLCQSRNEATQAERKARKEPPPVPKRNFVKSDIQFSLDKQKTHNTEKLTNGDLGETKQNLLSKDSELEQKQGKSKHIFSARQNNYIKCQRYTATDDEQGDEFGEGDLKVSRRAEKDEEMVKDSEPISSDLHALKELERARLGDRIHEKNTVANIDEETRVKNDLISRELRNIKKGMLSMRGNTSAKREIFAKKKEQSKEEAFTKIDNNVIINKALINDNYDKAKMALEEIISDRQTRRSKVTNQEANPVFDAGDESYVTRTQQSKRVLKESLPEAKDKLSSTKYVQKESDLRERLGELRDHNHMREILSQTEPRLGESHRSGGRVALPGLGNEAEYHKNDHPSYFSDGTEVVNLSHSVRSEDNNLTNEHKRTNLDVPFVPPRSRKGGNRRHGSISQERDLLKGELEVDNYENGLEHLVKEITITKRTDVACERSTKESLPNQSERICREELRDVVSKASSKPYDPTLPSKYSQCERRLSLISEPKGTEMKSKDAQADMIPTREATSHAKTQETFKVKRKAPAVPHHLTIPAEATTRNLAAEDPDDEHVDEVPLSETPRNIISPLLLVNGLSINQSPPDQASLSSKSSYFSMDSAMHRNTETRYQSLENLLAEVEGVDRSGKNSKQDSDRPEGEYYSLSDHESEPEFIKEPVKSRKEEVPHKESIEGENTSLTHEDNNQTAVSPSSTFSPTLGIPALFKIKDNTFSNKSKRPVQPWPPRGSLSGSEKGGDESHQGKQNPDLPSASETAPCGSTSTTDTIFKPKEILSNQSTPLLLSPSQLPRENPKKPQVGDFLAVPQEEDRCSGLSPSTASTADTAEEMGMNTDAPVEREVSKVPSERSGSTCSGNDSQTGLPKPPAVLPKSERAVLKAMKLATRRMKKEEGQNSSHSSSKHKSDRHRSHKSELKGSRNARSSENKHREKSEDNHHHGTNSSDRNEQIISERRSHASENLSKTRRQSHCSVESDHIKDPPVAPERQGRSNSRHVRNKPEQRHYSSDRVISSVPVYKAQLGDGPVSDQRYHRTQSIDRYLGGKVERRLSADVSAIKKADLRGEHTEMSLMDELQQRGRAKEKSSGDNPLRRSHSIDAYALEVPHPSALSRQSSHTSQLSRQSSIEHTIVTQSFPMTQRKLLQDPESGQYFFVDMPVQVKTKTFFDPETRSYVQLPVQPPDGAVLQASPMEVLTPPMVVYHGFVPVPLSPMAPKAPVQAPHLEPEELRHLERQMHCKEGHPYLEPVYGQNDHVLGEFLGTEELDCPG